VLWETGWNFKVLSNPNHSVILLFYETGRKNGLAKNISEVFVLVSMAEDVGDIPQHSVSSTTNRTEELDELEVNKMLTSHQDWTE